MMMKKKIIFDSVISTCFCIILFTLKNFKKAKILISEFSLFNLPSNPMLNHPLMVK